MDRILKLFPVVLLLFAGCLSPSDRFETRTLTDTQGDTTPTFVDVTATRVSQVEVWLAEFEFTVAGAIPTAPDASYQNVVYKMWIDSNSATTYPAHGGGNAEYVVSFWYNHLSSTWGGDIFDCATSMLVPGSSFDVTISGSTLTARVDLSLMGDPASFRYSFESFTDTQGHDGNSNATMDEISLHYS